MASFGQPVQIVNFRLLPNQPSRLALERTNLKHILKKVGNVPICLISIAGASRQGKSFLLTVILNVLDRLSQGDPDYWHDLEQLDRLNGFHFQNGTERDTVGLWLWSKPFILTKSDGSKIAVMLMDTQGVFDTYTTERDWSMIVGLSLLTSSCLIYNLFTNMQEDTLRIFYNFVEFGMLTLEEDSNATSAFQKLLFLIRDWNFPNTYTYGPLGGAAFLASKLTVTPKMPPEVTKVRQTLKTCFEEIACFLMPNPGDAAKENDFAGALHTLSETFRTNLRLFVDTLLTVDDLKPIKVGNDVIDGNGLLTYFERYIEVFNERTMPEPRSLYEAMEEARLGACINRGCSQARSKLEEILTSCEFVPTQDLKRHCDTLGRETLVNFTTEGKTKQQDLFNRYRTALTTDLKTIFNEIFQKNEESKGNIMTTILDKILIAYKSRLLERTLQTLLVHDLDEILTLEMSSFLDQVKQACQGKDAAFINEAHIKAQLLMDTLNKEFAEQNSTRFDEIQKACHASIGNCTQEYNSLMGLALTSDLKLVTKEKLFQTHKTCEAWVLPKFMSHLSNETQTIQEHFLHQFNNGINKILQDYAERYETARNEVSTSANNLYAEAFNTYITAMTKLTETGASESELKNEHRFKVLEARHKLNHINMICTPEEARQFENDMQEDTTQFFDELIHRINSAKENLQRRLDDTVDNAVTTYTRNMTRLLHSTTDKPLTNSDLEKEHELILAQILSKVSSMDWISPENSQTMEQKITQGIQGPYQDAQASNKCNQEQAELTAISASSEFVVMYDEKMQAHISKVSNPIELNSAHNHLKQDIEKNTRQAFVHLPAHSVDKVWNSLQTEMNQRFEEHKQSLEIIMKENESKMEQVVADYVLQYKLSMENVLDNMKHVTDADLIRFHERSKSRIMHQLNNVLHIYERYDQQEVQKQFQEKVDQTFTQFKKDTLDQSKDLNAKISNLRSQAISNYQQKYEQRKIHVQNEDGLTQIHENLSLTVLEEFERNFVEIGDMQRFRKEKVSLQSEFHDMHRQFCNLFLEQSDQSDKEIRKEIFKILDKYKITLENDLEPFYCVLDSKIQTLHASAFSDALNQLYALSLPPNSDLKTYEQLLSQNIEDSYKLFQNGNNTKNEALREHISTRVVQLSQELRNELNAMNAVDDSTLRKMAVKYMDLCVESVLSEYSLDNDESVTAFCVLQMTAASTIACDEWKATEVSEADIDYHLRQTRDTYINEMDKRISSHPGKFVHTTELHKMHVSVSQLVQLAFEKNIRQTTKSRQRFDDMIHELFRKYDGDNTLRAAEIADPAIGIDLGTTYSCTAIYFKGNIVMIPDQNSHRNVTPSYVLFETLSKVVVGESAKDQAEIFPEATIFDAKRLIGHKFTDEVTQNDIKTWPFKVVRDSETNDRPKINVLGQTYFPEEICAKILKKLKNDAEKYLGRKVENAVITVPAYFNDAQKTATKNAGNLAGLKVMGILNEPTSAAIAYSLNYTDDKARNIMVYDLGGGTFDVSVLTVQGGDINVKAVAGDNHLGGEDFDTNMLKHCISEFHKTNKIQLDKDGTEFEINSRLRRIRAKCEQQKFNLSVSSKVTISLDRIYKDKHMRLEITREQFEQMNETLFQKTLTIVTGALTDAQIGVDEINDIVLVGGSTRIPRVQELLQEYFNGKSFNMAINPDEVVAQGAAILAAMKSAATVKELGQIQFSDVAPLSLGIKVKGGGFSSIIKRNTKVPISKTKTYTTTYDQQTSVIIDVYEGEDGVAQNNNLLGTFTMNGIPAGPARKEAIDVTMSCNAEGILNVTACCTSTGGKKEITIKSQKTGLTEEEIKELKDK